MSAEHKRTVEAINAAFATNDVEAFLKHCTDDVEWTMVGDQALKGKDRIRQAMGNMPAEPPKFTVTSMVAEGEYVAGCGDMTMNEKGVTVPYSYCDVYRFRDGSVSELKTFVIKTDAK